MGKEFQDRVGRLSNLNPEAWWLFPSSIDHPVGNLCLTFLQAFHLSSQTEIFSSSSSSSSSSSPSSSSSSPSSSSSSSSSSLSSPPSPSCMKIFQAKEARELGLPDECQDTEIQTLFIALLSISEKEQQNCEREWQQFHQNATITTNENNTNSKDEAKKEEEKGKESIGPSILKVGRAEKRLLIALARHLISISAFHHLQFALAENSNAKAAFFHLTSIEISSSSSLSSDSSISSSSSSSSSSSLSSSSVSVSVSVSSSKAKSEENGASFWSSPVMMEIGVIVVLIAVLTKSYKMQAMLGIALGAVYLTVGMILSFVWEAVLGRVYAANQHLFRPYSGFTLKYMLLHPFLLGQLMAVAWLEIGRALVVVNSALNLALPFPALLFSLFVCLCGSLPVYTLGFASYKTPASIVLSWQIHTSIQLFVGGLFLHLFSSFSI